MNITGSKVLIMFCCLVMLAGCGIYAGKNYGYYTGKRRPPPDHNNTPVTQVHNSEPTTQGNHRNSRYHYVHRGDTLYSIAWRYGLDVRELARWNRIKPPYTIYPNQKIVLFKSKTTKQHKDQPKGHTNDKKKGKDKQKKPEKGLKIRWQWPTKGKIIGRYVANDRKKTGLKIAGRNGQHVYAAAKGKVVFSDSGLRGYGKLIIIKHNEVYYSAYAHNNKLLVREGQSVKKGQHIANMGRTGTDKTMLHFEIRRSGKPVNPLHYLPKRH